MAYSLQRESQQIHRVIPTLLANAHLAADLAEILHGGGQGSEGGGGGERRGNKTKKGVVLLWRMRSR